MSFCPGPSLIENMMFRPWFSFSAGSAPPHESFCFSKTKMFLAQRRGDHRGPPALIEGSEGSEFCEVFKFDKGLELFDRNRSFHGPQLQSQTGDFERISIPAPACRASGSVQATAGANDGITSHCVPPRFSSRRSSALSLGY